MVPYNSRVRHTIVLEILFVILKKIFFLQSFKLRTINIYIYIHFEKRKESLPPPLTMLRSQIIQTRSFTSITRNLSWFGDIFGKNKSSIESKQKRQDIITKQDELIESNSIKIHHLTFKNSDKYQSFNIESDMPNFHKLKNWKFQNAIVLRPEDFDADNIYLNQERTDYEKNLQLQKLVQKVKISQSQQ